MGQERQGIKAKEKGRWVPNILWLISSSLERQAGKAQTSPTLRTPAPTFQETKQPKAQVLPYLTEKVSQGGDSKGATLKGKGNIYIYTYMYE